MTILFNKPQHLEKRRELRNASNQAEQMLWERLRRNALGVKFKRQYGIEYFVVDFFAPSLKLAVEIDGSSHDTKEQQEYDAKRQAYIEQLGIQFLRFPNELVVRDLDKVVAEIKSVINTQTPFNKTPSPYQGEG